MQHLQTNTTLQGGKYRIERVLGQGGFGITYLAYQPSLQRDVAIKEFFMKDYCSRDDDSRTMTSPSLNRGGFVEKYRKKFIKEARNLARLKHPHIISVIDVFEENDTVYYVMPYLSKGSLQDYVENHGALSEHEAMKYVKQIALALKYMHEEQHICHYDVKPANILVDDKDNAVLIDFGISKNYDAKGQETTTTPVGVSEGYAPIEQYQQNLEEFSPASDVYALGATLYFLLHGRRPIDALRRFGGTSLMMKKNLSPYVKNIINSTLKLSKVDRPKRIDVFIDNIAPKSPWKVIVIFAIVCVFFIIIMFLSKCEPNENAPSPTSTTTPTITTSSIVNQDLHDQSSVEIFNSKIKDCQWYNYNNSFKYPNFMKHSNYFVDDSASDVDVFSWENIEVAYWSILGYWAVDIAENGNYISPSATISNVTYKVESKGIYSGFTSDGRIYYLKTKVLDDEVPHATVLALIYPKEFKNSDGINTLTKIVQNW